MTHINNWVLLICRASKQFFQVQSTKNAIHKVVPNHLCNKRQGKLKFLPGIVGTVQYMLCTYVTRHKLPAAASTPTNFHLISNIHKHQVVRSEMTVSTTESRDRQVYLSVAVGDESRLIDCVWLVVSNKAQFDSSKAGR